MPTVTAGSRMLSTYRARDRSLVFTFADDAGASRNFVVTLAEWVTGVGLTRGEIADAVPDTAPATTPDTPPAPFHRCALEALPEEMTGWSVLDVGGYDGLVAGTCARRGASPVRVLDNGEWQNYHWRPPPTPPGVGRVGCDVLVWEQPADLVVFGNVVYHMRDPWRALRHLRTLCRREMLMWTSFVPGDEAAWVLAEEPGPTNDGVAYEGYFTVYWKPTIPGLVRLLERTGWTRIEELGRFGDHVVVRCAGGPL